MQTGPIHIGHAAVGLSAALDLVSKDLVRHHLQTAAVAATIGGTLDLDDDELAHLTIAAALHDVGAIALDRDGELFSDDADLHHHAEVGAVLLRTFPPFEAAAEIVRHHHTRWAGDPDHAAEDRPSLSAQILHLADRVAARIRPEESILTQAAAVREAIAAQRGSEFEPQVVEAFLEAARRDVFWLEAVHADFPNLPGFGPAGEHARLDPRGLVDLSELFRMVIDFRSRHTATHSKSVAAVSERLARLMGFSGRGCTLMYVAGNLHDLGKLAIPVSILDKPGPLTADEFAIVRAHPFYTGSILRGIHGFEEIAEWAALHHEHADGSGYPWGLDGEEVPLGARVVSVADAFSALAERRSYRPALPRDEIFAAMRRMAARRQIDPFVFSILERNVEEIEACRAAAIAESERQFEDVRAVAAAVHAGGAAPSRRLHRAVAALGTH